MAQVTVRCASSYANGSPNTSTADRDELEAEHRSSPADGSGQAGGIAHAASCGGTSTGGWV
jgi:hypothetical protein